MYTDDKNKEVTNGDQALSVDQAVQVPDVNVTSEMTTQPPTESTSPKMDSSEPLSNRAISNKKRLQMEKYFEQLYKKQLRETAKATKRLKATVKVLRKNLGKESFNKLKDLMTTIVPEEKNEKGEVVKESYKEINYVGIISEGLNLIALLREERIKQGKRKKTTGRSSRRRSHRNQINFLNRRSELLKTEEVKQEVKL